MNNDILVSVIIPVFNVEDYLGECLDSVLSQTYNNLEILIIDDGSTDNSGYICDQYSDSDSRVKVFHVSNGGQSKARNIALKNSQGDYIAFVDSDDVIDSNMIEVLLYESLSNNCSLACIDFREIGDTSLLHKNKHNHFKENKLLTAREALVLLSTPNSPIMISYCVWTKLYKKEILKDLFFPEGMVYEEIVFNTKAILKSKNIIYIGKELYSYRIRSGSATNESVREKYIKKLMLNWVPLSCEKNLLLQDTGWMDVINSHKARDYIDLLYYEYYINNTKNDSFKNQTKRLLNEWRLNTKEIINLPYSFTDKTIVFLKMKAQFLFICLYCFKRIFIKS